MKTIKVEDMNCMACYQKIQTSLLKEKIVPKIDLMKKEVLVQEKDLTKASEIIKKAGYTPKYD